MKRQTSYLKLSMDSVSFGSNALAAPVPIVGADT